jgi:hypothetical protein
LADFAKRKKKEEADAEEESESVFDWITGRLGQSDP